MNRNLNFLSLWFGIVMVVLVTAGAIAFIFTDFMSDRLYGNKRIIMSVVFLAYAIYRGIRIYQVFKSSNRNNED